MNNHPTLKIALRLALALTVALAVGYLTSCSMSLTKLPDGTFAFTGAIAQPVTVKGGEK